VFYGGLSHGHSISKKNKTRTKSEPRGAVRRLARRAETQKKEEVLSCPRRTEPANVVTIDRRATCPKEGRPRRGGGLRDRRAYQRCPRNRARVLVTSPSFCAEGIRDEELGKSAGAIRPRLHPAGANSRDRRCPRGAAPKTEPERGILARTLQFLINVAGSPFLGRFQPGGPFHRAGVIPEKKASWRHTNPIARSQRAAP